MKTTLIVAIAAFGVAGAIWLGPAIAVEPGMDANRFPTAFEELPSHIQDGCIDALAVQLSQRSTRADFFDVDPFTTLHRDGHVVGYACAVLDQDSGVISEYTFDDEGTRVP